MNRETLSRWCERGIAGLVIGILVFSVLAIGAVRLQEFLVVQALTVGVLALWLVRLWLQERPRLFWPPVCWAVLAFVLYAVARYLTAPIEYDAREELIRVLVYASLFFAILNNLHRPESVTLIVRVLVFLAMGVAGYAVYQYLAGDPHVWQFTSPYEHRGRGTFINPNHFAGFLELILPVGLAVVILGRRRGVVLAILMMYALLVMFAGLAVSFSRGGWLGAAVALLALFVVLLFRRSHRWMALAVLGLVLILTGVFFAKSFSSRHRLARAFGAGEVNTEMRSALWEPAIALWKENPWFGVGPGHFDPRFWQYRPAQVQVRPEYVHNDYLNTLTDWGLVGVGLVGLIWALAGAGAVRTWRQLPHVQGMGVEGSDRLGFILGASCGLLAILVHSLTDYNMHIPSNAMIVVTWLALLTTHQRYISNRSWIRSPIVVRGAVPVMGLLCAAYLVAQGQVCAREQIWLKRAAREASPSPAYLAAMESAFAADGRNYLTAFEIGEAHRMRAWELREGWEEEARAAIRWFERTAALNRYYPFAPLRCGMCLDWLGQHPEAEPYFRQADKLDPRGYHTAQYIGWHFLQVYDYPAAQTWFERSLHLKWEDNAMSAGYLRIIRDRMLEAATNPLALPPLPE